ncbi:MAG: hypothetical protein ACXIVF_04700 [Rhizobiaceae bacterium]
MATFPVPDISLPSLAWLRRILRRRTCRRLTDLANRPDDRLLRDIGLTREEVLGVEGTFWRELERTRKPWSL